MCPRPFEQVSCSSDEVVFSRRARAGEDLRNVLISHRRRVIMLRLYLDICSKVFVLLLRAAFNLKRDLSGAPPRRNFLLRRGPRKGELEGAMNRQVRFSLGTFTSELFNFKQGSEGRSVNKKEVNSRRLTVLVIARWLGAAPFCIRKNRSGIKPVPRVEGALGNRTFLGF